MEKEKTTQTQVLSFTPQAAQEIRQVMSQEGVPKTYKLRVGIRGGGCGSMGYVLGFDEQKETDDAYEVDGIPVLIDKRHGMYVMGMEIDFHESDTQRGFVFNNPSARKD